MHMYVCMRIAGASRLRSAQCVCYRSLRESFVIFQSSLSMLDKNVTRKLPFQPSKSFFDMYRGLFVLQRQVCVPVSGIELPWDSRNKHKALSVDTEMQCRRPQDLILRANFETFQVRNSAYLGSLRRSRI